ncbi:MAG: hypothetical protein M1511_03065 [Deltaproteobacteria bacterium]|nr:hypothetical protein [Deltaproteobacteria bacterium]
MKKFIFLMALIVLFGGVSKSVASDRGLWRLQLRYQKEMSELKKQDAKWKAFMNEGTNFLQNDGSSVIKSNKKGT